MTPVLLVLFKGHHPHLTCCGGCSKLVRLRCEMTLQHSASSACPHHAGRIAGPLHDQVALPLCPAAFLAGMLCRAVYSASTWAIEKHNEGTCLQLSGMRPPQ